MVMGEPTLVGTGDPGVALTVVMAPTECHMEMHTMATTRMVTTVRTVRSTLMADMADTVDTAATAATAATVATADMVDITDTVSTEVMAPTVHPPQASAVLGQLLQHQEPQVQEQLFQAPALPLRAHQLLHLVLLLLLQRKVRPSNCKLIFKDYPYSGRSVYKRMQTDNVEGSLVSITSIVLYGRFISFQEIKKFSTAHTTSTVLTPVFDRFGHLTSTPHLLRCTSAATVAKN